jgi:hypothetical protein
MARGDSGVVAAAARDVCHEAGRPLRKMSPDPATGRWFDSQEGRVRHRVLIPQAEGAAGASLSPPNAAVSPSKSATVTVSAEWPLLRSGDATFCAK